LEGIDRVEKVFLVDWKELSAGQQNAVLEKISKRSGARKDAILKDVLKVGLPLRALGFGSIDLQKKRG